MLRLKKHRSNGGYLALDNKGFNTRVVRNQLISLLEKKMELQPQYEKLRDELDALNVQISALSQALKVAGIDPYKIREKVHLSEPQVNPIRKIDTIPEVIYKMLKAYKVPMHYTEIWRRLDMSGYNIGGKDRANTTLAYISRNKDRFMKAPEAGRGYYKIKE